MKKQCLGALKSFTQNHTVGGGGTWHPLDFKAQAVYSVSEGKARLLNSRPQLNSARKEQGSAEASTAGGVLASG